MVDIGYFSFLFFVSLEKILDVYGAIFFVYKLSIPKHCGKAGIIVQFKTIVSTLHLLKRIYTFQ